MIYDILTYSGINVVQLLMDYLNPIDYINLRSVNKEIQYLCKKIYKSIPEKRQGKLTISIFSFYKKEIYITVVQALYYADKFNIKYGNVYIDGNNYYINGYYINDKLHNKYKINYWNNNIIEVQKYNLGRLKYIKIYKNDIELMDTSLLYDFNNYEVITKQSDGSIYQHYIKSNNYMIYNKFTAGGNICLRIRIKDMKELLKIYRGRITKVTFNNFNKHLEYYDLYIFHMLEAFNIYLKEI